MGSGLYGRKEKPKMPHKSKDTKSGQIPCQRQTDEFFRTGLQQKYTCMERHILSTTIRNKFSTRQPSLEIRRKAVNPER